MPYDWLTSTTAARRELYYACKRVVDGHYLGNWARFFQVSIGQTRSDGTGYEDNFRAGRISRKKAASLSRWLSEHHAQEAERLALRILAIGDAAPSPWDDFVAKKGQKNGISIVRLSDLGIVSFAHPDPDGLPRLRLGEAFCLRLDAEADGNALALQKAGGRWFALPLSDQSMHVPITTGTAFLPRATQSGSIIPLSDNEDGGRVMFIVIVSAASEIEKIAATIPNNDPIPLAVLDRIAARLQRAAHAAAHRVEVIIR
jgi:hypothetical protein